MKIVVDEKPQFCYECPFCKADDYKRHYCTLTELRVLDIFDDADCEELISFSEMIYKYKYD